jgi:beta-glucanase (GH16 family)
MAGPDATAPDGYELVWADEFDGDELDTDRWDHRGLGPRRDGVNTEDSVALDGDGHLVLTTRRVGDEYHTAMIGTQGKFEAQFGYFECRVKMQTQVGHWSAFWLQTPDMGKLGDVQRYGAEIDIFEYLARTPELLRFNLHWDGYGEEHKHAGRDIEVEDLDEGFHTIALEWLPDRYVLYYDGEKVHETTQAVSHREQYMILSLEVGEWAGDIAEAELPDSLVVDYVRVYQRK